MPVMLRLRYFAPLIPKLDVPGAERPFARRRRYYEHQGLQNSTQLFSVYQQDSTAALAVRTAGLTTGGAFRCTANLTTMAGVRVVASALLDGGDSGHGGARGNLPTPAASSSPRRRPSVSTKG